MKKVKFCVGVYVQILPKGFATLCCTELQQAVFRSCSACRTLQHGSSSKHRDGRMLSHYSNIYTGYRFTSGSSTVGLTNVQCTQHWDTIIPQRSRQTFALHRTSYYRNPPPGHICFSFISDVTTALQTDVFATAYSYETSHVMVKRIV